MNAKLLVIFVIVAVCTISAYADDRKPICIKENQKCNNSGQCCTGCCKKSVCRDKLRCERRPAKTCNPPCPKDEKCVLKQVQCVRAPCDPVPVCVSRKSGGYRPTV